MRYEVVKNGNRLGKGLIFESKEKAEAYIAMLDPKLSGTGFSVREEAEAAMEGAEHD